MLPEVGVFVENGDHVGEGFYVGFRVLNGDGSFNDNVDEFI